MRSARIVLRSVLLGSAVVVAFLAGCSNDTPSGPGPDAGGGGGGGDTPASESVPDPCTLVTKDAVEAAVGGAVGEPTHDLISTPSLDGGRQCSFETADGKGSFLITIFPVTPELFAIDKQEAQMMGGADEVTGLGDAAFTSGYTSLHVLKGQYLLQLSIDMVDYDPGESLKHLNTLARASLDKL